MKAATIILILALGCYMTLFSIPSRAYYHSDDEDTSMVIIETFTASVSAYSSSVDETDENPFEMASGKRVYRGAVACPSRYSFGTKVKIDEKVYVCEDRMNKRYREKNYFDIWMESKEKAYEFGRVQFEVEIIG